ncbi:uncharacterized protein BO80DRAFT_161575 [Aspergillus ibericus CBS 121593]|uniref:Uncharacterized protein n=1 Tax=Aspergillus ibericus CBS 121593 TaxID=1448316 RepID=A0A395GTU4_9EURO|nr:hypothetical protein BO80DRAFT_161575 [Aspergillus ibericus CBS 121593]RAK98378.1 hypothetical protein BO80DRAFT_161575 [Aspergillus ibericus CBS 121593]
MCILIYSLRWKHIPAFYFFFLFLSYPLFLGASDQACIIPFVITKHRLGSKRGGWEAVHHGVGVSIIMFRSGRWCGILLMCMGIFPSIFFFSSHVMTMIAFWDGIYYPVSSHHVLVSIALALALASCTGQ